LSTVCRGRPEALFEWYHPGGSKCASTHSLEGPAAFGDHVFPNC